MTEPRVVVVTGGAGGIGSAIVERFLRNGDLVIAADRAEEPLQRLREQLADPDRLRTAVADVTSRSEVERIADVGRDAGGVDVLVNCAGYFPSQPFETMTEEDLRTVIDANLTSLFFVTQAVLPLIKGRPHGRIINMGSGSFFSGTPNYTHYTAAKGGLLGFTRSLAREVGQYGITVNAISPGVTITPPVLETYRPETIVSQVGRRAIQRDQLPADLVEPVLFLASEGAGFITGHTLVVDGGIAMI